MKILGAEPIHNLPTEMSPKRSVILSIIEVIFMSRTALAILSTENLLHNINVIKHKINPGTKIIAMVKANAYGHGLRSVSLRIQEHVDMLGVASIDEALALRKAGITIPIMLAEGVFESSELIIASTEKFHVVFHDPTQVEWLNKLSCPIPLNAWFKINTGMGRLGFNLDVAPTYYNHLLANKQVQKPLRILSHLACADIMEHPLNAKQLSAFSNFIQDKEAEYSLCNSAAIFAFPEHHYDFVRPGLAIYGVSPVEGKTASDLDLKPVMTIQTSLIAVHKTKKGDTLGYGARYTCEEDMPIGVVAFGYGDGYPVTAQDGTPILVNNKICKLAGRVSMDMLTVDLRSCPQAKVGDPVILWGQGLPIEEVTHFTSSITYQILSGVQHRVKFLWTK